MVRKALTGSAVALTVAAAACGSAQPLSSAQLTEKAGAICAQLHDQIGALAREQRAITTKAQLIAQLKAGAVKRDAYRSRALDQLAALKPPAEMKREYEALIRSLEARRQITRQIRGRVSPATMRRLSVRFTDQSHAAQRLSAQLHLGRCES